jgi:16S rRNA G966 N2-methylase RsmD
MPLVRLKEPPAPHGTSSTFLAEIATYLSAMSPFNVRPERDFLDDFQLYIGRYINPETPYTGVLVYHGLGSGKTRAAISACSSFLAAAAEDKENQPEVIVLSKASLQENFLAEWRTLEKYKAFVQQYNTFASFSAYLLQHAQVVPGDLNLNDGNYKAYIKNSPRVMDSFDFEGNEGSFLRTHFTFLNYNGGVAFDTAFKALQLDNKVVIIDEMHNFLSMLVNALDMDNYKYQKMMLAQNMRLIALSGTPLLNSVFEMAILINVLARKRVFPENKEQFMQRYYDPQGEFKKAEENNFKHKLMGYISFYGGLTETAGVFPTKIPHAENVPMSEHQFDTYVVARQTEIKTPRRPGVDSYSDFRAKSRAVCNFAYPNKVVKEENLDNLDNMLSLEQLKESYSPKMARLIQHVQAAPGKVLIFSSFKKFEGINILMAALQQNGFVPYSAGAGEGANRFAYWDSAKEKESKAILEAFNHRDNMRGENLKILLISKSGAEGISTTCVRQVHVLESYWNEALIEQVIGRASRLNSHADLPLDEQTVDIYRYTSVFTEEQKLSGKLHESKSSDEAVYEIAQKKVTQIRFVEGLMRETAVDCFLNQKKANEAQCFYVSGDRGDGDRTILTTKLSVVPMDIFNIDALTPTLSRVQLSGEFSYHREGALLTIYSFTRPIGTFKIHMKKKAMTNTNTTILTKDEGLSILGEKYRLVFNKENKRVELHELVIHSTKLQIDRNHCLYISAEHLAALKKSNLTSAQISKKIQSFVRGNHLSFPFKKFFLDEPYIFEKLQKMDNTRLSPPPNPSNVQELLQRCYASKKDKQSMLPLFKDFVTKTVLLYKPQRDDYATMDIITDYFTEHLRIKCAIYNKKSPLDVWEAQDFSYEPLLLKETEITAETLREYLYRERIIAECTQFKPTLFVTLLRFFKATNVLDTSAGWGDRLIAALATEVNYTGIDPAPALHGCYKEIIETLKSNSSAQTIKMIKNGSEHVRLEPNSFDFVFSSPPYFKYELYNSAFVAETEEMSEERWLRHFMYPTLDNSWRALQMGKIMVLYLCNNPNFTTTAQIHQYVCKTLKGTFLGIIGSQSGTSTTEKYIALWIYQKTVNVAVPDPVRSDMGMDMDSDSDNRDAIDAQPVFVAPPPQPVFVAPPPPLSPQPVFVAPPPLSPQPVFVAPPPPLSPQPVFVAPPPQQQSQTRRSAMREEGNNVNSWISAAAGPKAPASAAAARPKAPTCSSLFKFKNYRNSCFSDSVLFALFAQPSNTITQMVENLRNYEDNTGLLKILKKVYDTYQNDSVASQSERDFCVNIRRLLPGGTPPYEKLGQHDANEFLLHLLNYLPPNISVTHNKKIIYQKSQRMQKTPGVQIQITEKETDRVETDKFLLIKNTTTFDPETRTYTDREKLGLTEEQYINYDYWVPEENSLLKTFPKSIENRKMRFARNFNNFYDTLINETTYEIPPDQDILIVAVNRFKHVGKSTKDTANFDIQQECYGLNLAKIIVHTGETLDMGHYVVFFTCEGQWYLYDDLKSEMQLIGTFNDVIMHREWVVTENCTTLFYQRLSPDLATDRDRGRSRSPSPYQSMMIESSSSSSSDSAEESVESAPAAAVAAAAAPKPKPAPAAAAAPATAADMVRIKMMELRAEYLKKKQQKQQKQQTEQTEQTVQKKKLDDLFSDD